MKTEELLAKVKARRIENGLGVLFTRNDGTLFDRYFANAVARDEYICRHAGTFFKHEIINSAN